MTNTFDTVTPRGHRASFEYRPDTNDRGIVESCCADDEYALRTTHLTGTVIDVGSHIGAVAIAVAIDNPDCRVVAVEPLRENVLLLRNNVQRNGLEDRIEVIHGAVGDGYPVDIRWGHAGNEDADTHRYIGNQRMPVGIEHQIETVDSFTLEDLADGEDIELVITDCEGGEYAFLGGPGTGRVVNFVGEYHGSVATLTALLAPTHHVTTVGGDGLGHFTARRRVPE